MHRCRRIVAISALLAAVAFAAIPARAQVDTIFVVPGAHFDFGFDDLPSRVREHRIQAVEEALSAAEADPDFHWMEDAAWGFGGWLERYQGDPIRMARARRALANGQLTVSAAWVNPHGALFHESLGLLTVHLDTMKRLLGSVPQVAVLDDAPSQPEALVDALAARGVRYVLLGSTMRLGPFLPTPMVRSPFWWQSSRGARVLVYMDPNGYSQAGTSPSTGDIVFADREPPPDVRALLATADSSFRSLLAASPATYDALVFEHAADDAGVSSATPLPQLIRDWNGAGRMPHLVLSSPLAYFRHIEARYGTKLPVLRGEWGRDWDGVRGACPVWTWRLRQALKRARADSPTAVREALATAMDHGLTLGPGWPDVLTEAQTIAHDREQAGILARAVDAVPRHAGRDGRGIPLSEALPEPPKARGARRPDPRWRELLADSAAIRVCVVGGGFASAGELVPLVLSVPLSLEDRGARRLARVRLDRRRTPGTETATVIVTLDVPLRASVDRLRIVPRASRAARQGRWLRGAPPGLVVAPEGVRVTGLAHALQISSPLAFAYALAADPGRPAVTWLQILLVRDGRRCELEGGESKVLAFEDLYPGEPAVLDTWVDMKVLRGR